MRHPLLAPRALVTHANAPQHEFGDSVTAVRLPGRIICTRWIMLFEMRRSWPADEHDCAEMYKEWLQLRSQLSSALIRLTTCERQTWLQFKCGRAGCLLNMVGMIFLGVSHTAGGVNLLHPGAILIGLGGITFHLAQFHISGAPHPASRSCRVTSD